MKYENSKLQIILHEITDAMFTIWLVIVGFISLYTCSKVIDDFLTNNPELTFNIIYLHILASFLIIIPMLKHAKGRLF